MSIEFWITALIITVTPGTGVLFTIATGINRGPRTALLAVAGCVLGIVPHLLAAVSGAALLLAASATAFSVLKWAGVAYLLVMAGNAIRTRDQPSVSDHASASGSRTVIKAVLVNLLNPKLTLFFFAFLPQFVDPARPDVMTQMLTCGAAFMAITLVVFSGYGLAAAAVRDKIINRPRVMRVLQRVFAVSFVALGIKLALTHQ